jgi:hypothetical protein
MSDIKRDPAMDVAVELADLRVGAEIRLAEIILAARKLLDAREAHARARASHTAKPTTATRTAMVDAATAEREAATMLGHLTRAREEM